jgi:hypothetical protein
MPVLVMVVTFIGGLRLFKADLIGFAVALACSLGAGLWAALMTLAVWGIAR